MSVMVTPEHQRDFEALMLMSDSLFLHVMEDVIAAGKPVHWHAVGRLKRLAAWAETAHPPAGWVGVFDRSEGLRAIADARLERHKAEQKAFAPPPPPELATDPLDAAFDRLDSFARDMADSMKDLVTGLSDLLTPLTKPPTAHLHPLTDADVGLIWAEAQAALKRAQDASLTMERLVPRVSMAETSSALLAAMYPPKNLIDRAQPRR